MSVEWHGHHLDDDKEVTCTACDWYGTVGDTDLQDANWDEEPGQSCVCPRCGEELDAA